MSKARRLEGKVTIVTGAASGIGEESARLFAEHGAYVVAADVQDELGQRVVDSIGSERVSFRHCDVTNESDVESLVKYAVETHGKLDVMFSNAGVIGPMSAFLEMDMSSFDHTMAVNVRGVAATFKHAGRAMVAGSTRGSLICTASVAACLGGTGPHAYTASKHALVGLVRTACGELGAHGIRVNCVSPFGVGTPLVCDAYGITPAQVEAQSAAAANLKGISLKPRHVAHAALFLASDDSLYVSGHNMVVDGGYTVVAHSYASPHHH